MPLPNENRRIELHQFIVDYKLKLNNIHQLETAKFMHQFRKNHPCIILKNNLLAQLLFTVIPLEHLSAMIV